MIVHIVRFKTKLSYDEVMAIAKKRAPEFESLPGLIQKYYVQYEEPETFGGVYIWESRHALDAYRNTNLLATIASSYEAIGAPKVEVLEGLFALRG